MRVGAVGCQPRAPTCCMIVIFKRNDTILKIDNTWNHHQCLFLPYFLINSSRQPCTSRWILSVSPCWTGRTSTSTWMFHQVNRSPEASPSTHHGIRDFEGLESAERTKQFAPATQLPDRFGISSVHQVTIQGMEISISGADIFSMKNDTQVEWYSGIFHFRTSLHHPIYI